MTNARSDRVRIPTRVDRALVPPSYQPVLAAAAASLPDDVALYLYGSVADGRAQLPASDVDLLTIGLPPQTTRQVSLDLSGRFEHLCREVSLAPAQWQELVAPDDAGHGLRVFLAHHCVHISGPDPARLLPAFPADAAAARGLDGDVAQRLETWKQRLVAGDAPEGVARAAARKTLLAAAGLVSVLSGGWTTDRATAADRLKEIDTSLGTAAHRLLEAMRDPPTTTAEAARLLAEPVGLIADAFAQHVGLWRDDRPVGRAAGALSRVAASLMDPPATAHRDWALETALAAAPVLLHFHPDRTARDGRTVVESLLDDGQYHSQWVTGISAGLVDPSPDGQRARWERLLFGDAYVGAAPDEHPVYGALDLHGHEDGASPRFGSCALVLAPHIRSRTTLTVGDSHTAPDGGVTGRGVADRLWEVAAGVEQRGWDECAAGRFGRHLDEYVEAQVHGGVSLGEDVVAVRADRSFADGAVGDRLRELAQAHDLDLQWTQHLELSVADVDADFRGPLAAEMAGWAAGTRGVTALDAATLGRAAAAAATSSRWAAPQERLQAVKYVWHHIVARGAPVA